MPREKPLLLGTDCDESRALATALEAEFAALPSSSAPDQFESWRSEAVRGPSTDAVVVAQFSPRTEAAPLREVDPKTWQERFERPYLLWNFALGAASRRCADGGAIVAVVQTPAALDSPGWTPEFAIADGVLGLIRSVAAAEGTRNVRANLVSTPIGLVSPPVIAPTPPLPSFPGRLETEVAGAVRTLLSADAVGLTGRLLSADGGRSL